MVVSNRNLLFQGSIFRGYVSFREGTSSLGLESWEHISNPPILNHSNSAVKTCSSVRKFHPPNKKQKHPIPPKMLAPKKPKNNNSLDVTPMSFPQKSSLFEEEDSTHLLCHPKRGACFGDFPWTLGRSGMLFSVFPPCHYSMCPGR